MSVERKETHGGSRHTTDITVDDVAIPRSETVTEKFMRKFKAQPFVPIGT